MNDLWAYKLLKIILLNNQKMNFYGFAIENNKKIYGVLLTFLFKSATKKLNNIFNYQSIPKKISGKH